MKACNVPSSFHYKYTLTLYTWRQSVERVETEPSSLVRKSWQNCTATYECVMRVQMLCHCSPGPTRSLGTAKVVCVSADHRVGMRGWSNEGTGQQLCGLLIPEREFLSLCRMYMYRSVCVNLGMRVWNGFTSQGDTIYQRCFSFCLLYKLGPENCVYARKFIYYIIRMCICLCMSTVWRVNVMNCIYLQWMFAHTL